ncbi:MAG: hypothetical protein U0869_24215 [Chloroflexota bacterium]
MGVMGAGRRARQLAVVRATSDRSAGSEALARAMLDAGLAAELAAGREPLLAALPAVAGCRVLEIGAGDGSLTRALVDAGALVDALEADDDLRAIAAARLLDVPGATLGSDLAGWRSDGRLADGVDLVIVHAPAAGQGAFEEVAGAALSATELAGPAGVVREGGAIALVLRAPLGLRHVARVVPGRLAPAGDRPMGLDAVAHVLATAGFPAQRRLALHGPGDAVDAIIDDAAWDDPAIAGRLPLVLGMLGRPDAAATDDAAGSRTADRPGSPGADGLPRSTWPALDDAFERVLAAGLGRALADRWLLVAARDEVPVAPVPGGAWIPGRPDRATEWRTGWRLERSGAGGGDGDGDTVLLTPEHAGPETWSGPLSWRPAALAVPAGQRGDRLLARALLEDGIDAPGTLALLGAWAQAAGAADAGPERTPVEIGPERCVVDAAGTWHLLPGPILARFPVPFEVRTHRAVARLLVERVLPSGIPAGLDPSATVAESAAALLRRAGTPVAEGSDAMALDLEIELRRRTAPGTADGLAIRRIVRREHGARIGTLVAGTSVAWLAAAATRWLVAERGTRTEDGGTEP